MSDITIRIDKGRSPASLEAQEIISSFPGFMERKRHYSAILKEEDVFRFSSELIRLIELMPQLDESEWFRIPDYGTNEWADWLIDLHLKGQKSPRKGNGNYK